MATFPEIAKHLKKENIITAASKHCDVDLNAFEKDGCTWVGWLGFEFDAKNELRSISPSWSYGEEAPCNSDL